MKEVIITIWHYLKAQFHGIKVKGLNLLESAMLAIRLTGVSSSRKNSTIPYATSTTGTLSSTDVFLATKNLGRITDVQLLEKYLGITKEGVHRLIWLLEGVRDTNNGLEAYSSETISLVKNALLKERILKQTTILLDSQPSLMKMELLPMNRQWHVGCYGIKIMDGHFVGSVTEVKA